MVPEKKKCKERASDISPKTVVSESETAAGGSEQKESHVGVERP